VPVRLIFRCEICGRTPIEATRESLEHELLDPRFGEYVDAEPEHWLIWHGRGLYGIGRHPWAMKSQPGGREIDFARARRLARAAGPKF
jgi:hypothetical protein